MPEFSIIEDIVVILLISIPIILIFNKLKLPSIAGFLIAGMIIGPFGFELIANVDEIEIMAEVGVILLLFTIGLDIFLTSPYYNSCFCLITLFPRIGY